MYDLKPCPFCGGEAILETVDGNSPEECTGGPLRECRVPAHGDGSGEGKPPGVVRGGDHDHGTADGLCGGVKGGPHEIIV